MWRLNAEFRSHRKKKKLIQFLSLATVISHRQPNLNMFRNIYFAIYFVTLAMAFTPPSICVWEPILSISAGTDVTAKIGPSSRRCRADLHFDDTTYLALSWTFASIGCFGQETVTFTVPEGVPNGDAYITWSFIRCQKAYTLTDAVTGIAQAIRQSLACTCS